VKSLLETKDDAKREEGKQLEKISLNDEENDDDGMSVVSYDTLYFVQEKISFPY